jgi:tetratricopeptide (TPR) repeat protein
LLHKNLQSTDTYSVADSILQRPLSTDIDFGEMTEQSLREHLTANTQHPHAHALLAQYLKARQFYESALQEADAAIALAPDDGFCSSVRAEVLTKLLRLEEAEKAAVRATELEPDNASFFVVLTDVELQLGNYERALIAAHRGLEIEPQNFLFTSLASGALAKLGRFEEAIQLGSKAVAAQPNIGGLHANYGWVLLEAGRPEEALLQFTTAVDLNPQDQSAKSGWVSARNCRNGMYRLGLSTILKVKRLPRLVRSIVTIAALTVPTCIGFAAPGVLEPPWGFLLFLPFLWFYRTIWIDDYKAFRLTATSAKYRKPVSDRSIKSLNKCALMAWIGLAIAIGGNVLGYNAVGGCGELLLLGSAITGKLSASVKKHRTAKTALICIQTRTLASPPLAPAK